MMISEELQVQCNGILEEPDILDEDKIDRIEDLVREFYKDKHDADIERLVLDILWAQRREKDKNENPSENLTVDESSDEESNTVGISDEPLSTKQEDQTDQTISEEEISPFHMLKSIFGDNVTEMNIIQALDRTGYDLQRVIELAQESPKEEQKTETTTVDEVEDEVDARSKILCKYFVYSGECLRADCMYSHDPASRICKFWLQGSCLAGENCIFFHGIPESVVENLTLNEKREPSPPRRLDLNDTEKFPALGTTAPKKKSKKMPKIGTIASKESNQKPKNEISWAKVAEFRPSKPFSLNKLNPTRIKLVRPKHIPWEDPEFGSNTDYLKARHSAKRNGELRNNYLRLAVDSWNKNEAQMAKMLSKKGQLHNEKMLENYSLANEIISKQKDIDGGEIFIDMHGNDLDTVDDRLQEILPQLEKQKDLQPVYIISGAGRYDNKENGLDDNLSRTIKSYLDRNVYKWTDYHTSDKKFGQIIAVDIYSHL